MLQWVEFFFATVIWQFVGLCQELSYMVPKDFLTAMAKDDGMIKDYVQILLKSSFGNGRRNDEANTR